MRFLRENARFCDQSYTASETSQARFVSPMVVDGDRWRPRTVQSGANENAPDARLRIRGVLMLATHYVDRWRVKATGFDPWHVSKSESPATSAAGLPPSGFRHCPRMRDNLRMSAGIERLYSRPTSARQARQ